MNTKNGMCILEFKRVYEYTISLMFHQNLFHIPVEAFKFNQIVSFHQTLVFFLLQGSTGLCIPNTIEGQLEQMCQEMYQEVIGPSCCHAAKKRSREEDEEGTWQIE